MDWIQQWQSKLNKQNGVAPLVRTGGSRHTGLAALPYRNIHLRCFAVDPYTLGGNDVLVKLPAIPMPPLFMEQVLRFMIGLVKNEYSARDCAPQPLKLSIHSGGIEHPCRCR